MEIEIIQEKLAKALNLVSKVAMGGRTTLPVLSNVLIRSENKKVSLIATNLDLAIVDYVPVSDANNGVITVPARLLAEFVSNLPKGEMVKITVSGNKITTRAGKYSSTVNGMPADDFPELPEIDDKKAVKFKMGVEEFKKGLAGITIASSNDLTRPALTGVFFNTYEGSLYVAATDGYRLADRKFINKVKSEVAAIVPTNSLQEVLRSIDDSMDEIEIVFDESQARFRLGEVEITSKLIDGSFPDYRRLFPKDNEVKVEVDKDEFLRVAKLAALFARGVGGSINCEAKSDDNLFSVASVANEYGENNSEITAEVTMDGKVTLNSRYLIDALNVLDNGKVEMEFSKMNPVVLRNSGDSDYTHMIMPLKD